MNICIYVYLSICTYVSPGPEYVNILIKLSQPYGFGNIKEDIKCYSCYVNQI